MKVTPKKRFLLKQIEKDNKYEDVWTTPGVKIEVTDKEHQRFAQHFVEPFKKK